MSLPTSVPNPLPTDFTSDSTDQSPSSLDYVALFLDYFIALVIFHGILTLCYVLVIGDMPFFLLAVIFGGLLLGSTYCFYGGMFRSDHWFTLCRILTLLPFTGVIMIMTFNICIHAAGGPSEISSAQAVRVLLHLWHSCRYHLLALLQCNNSCLGTWHRQASDCHQSHVSMDSQGNIAAETRTGCVG
ncbi:hypothetical protein OG21DRAFT_144248 [Imleria badia]|nr:hypothetical protein OG21DRAFT_144248 [Imleria badia]